MRESVFRVLLFACRWRKLQRECPSLFDGRAARLGIEAVLAEESSYWDDLARLAREVGWEVRPDGTALYFTPHASSS